MSPDRLLSDGDNADRLANGQTREPKAGDEDYAPIQCSTLPEWRRALARFRRQFELNTPPDGWPIF
jgi:hypothetical protein